MGALEASGFGAYVQIDLGVVRGLAYYTGFVFEAFEANGEGRALAGGGRYHALVKKLEGRKCLQGFAMGDVTLVDLLSAKEKLPKSSCQLDFVAVIGGPEERSAALKLAAGLRASGFSVDYPLKDQGFGKQFKAAGQSGANFALIFGCEEVEQQKVKIRDLSSGDESECGLSDLVGRASGLLDRGLHLWRADLTLARLSCKERHGEILSLGRQSQCDLCDRGA